MGKMTSWLFVALQLTGLALVFATGPWWAGHPAWQAVEGAGIALGVWAVLIMGRHLRAVPEPAPGACLLRHGPFRFIRHPMYAATLLVVVALVADEWSGPRGAMAVALAAVLVLKLRREESLLLRRFPAYRDYARNTRRLVPWVW